ncbi:gustatory receptor for sugar taste 64f-like [Hyposmocoma kahamanoa]|uniref:gustatory receptor for sugar taste 64f-like n=1 Tax=Hyposmocoma kahamanoa TaxID=1477025 RepID=UPI000E6D89DE|nr:gustatory receptor for sugar taste 64f-like [Hyposmocoma kahamanoa]
MAANVNAVAQDPLSALGDIHPMIYGIEITTIQCTFNWNFADAFVICISLYLTSRLQQINDRIVAVRGKFAPALFYRTAREDYTKIVGLIRKIDEVINGVIFVSFAINVFIICMQLLRAIKPVHGYIQAIYLIYSFSFLLMRSLAVSLIASKVHTASRTSAEYLYDVPSSAYCSEVQRFLNQVHSDDVALTGLKFFNVKRGLVLTITATIITYELVLMQFAGVTPTLQPTTSRVGRHIGPPTPNVRLAEYQTSHPSQASPFWTTNFPESATQGHGSQDNIPSTVKFSGCSPVPAADLLAGSAATPYMHPRGLSEESRPNSAAEDRTSANDTPKCLFLRSPTANASPPL